VAFFCLELPRPTVLYTPDEAGGDTPAETVGGADGPGGEPGSLGHSYQVASALKDGGGGR
jgi:hypothetical protein